MAHAHSNSTSSFAATSNGDEVKDSGIFHDFLGKGSAPYSCPVVGAAPGEVRPPSESSPSASASLGASSAGGQRPISTTSDLGSERQAGNHFDGVPFYGPRSDFMGHETSNRLSGTKRSNFDSHLGTSKDRFPSVRPDSLDNSQLMKLLRHTGEERPRQPHDEEASFSMHVVRPISTSLMFQHSSGTRTDANTSRMDRGTSMNVGPPWQHPPRSSQVVPFGYQALSSKFRDSNAGTSVISQGAADEGSRTGIKEPGIWSSINASGSVSERKFSGPKIGSVKQKSGVHNAELESSTTLSPHGFTSGGCQMTIFYGGQAHVFDNVHPNKADVIMALAGSNGGSWTANYMPKSSTKPITGGDCTSSAKGNRGMTGSLVLPPEASGKLSVRVNSNELSSGVSQEDMLQKESRRTAIPANEKRDVLPH